MRGDGETESQTHPGRISFDGRVDKLLDARECHDRIQALIDLSLPHAENRAVEIDIFPAS